MLMRTLRLLAFSAVALAPLAGCTSGEVTNDTLPPAKEFNPETDKGAATQSTNSSAPAGYPGAENAPGSPASQPASPESAKPETPAPASAPTAEPPK